MKGRSLLLDDVEMSIWGEWQHENYIEVKEKAIVTEDNTEACLAEKHNHHIKVDIVCCQSSEKANTIIGCVYKQENFSPTSVPGTRTTTATSKLMAHSRGLMLQPGKSSENCEEKHSSTGKKKKPVKSKVSETQLIYLIQDTLLKSLLMARRVGNGLFSPGDKWQNSSR